MSNAYRAVQWNAHKKVYDRVLLLLVIAMLALFVGASVVLADADGTAGGPILPMRALGAVAGTLWTLLLCIGPLARLDPRFAPLLYNRRHLGVTIFGVALLHGLLALVWYHGFGVIDPLVSLLTSGTDPRAPGLPFQPFGLLALIVLALLASTSHDFWLHNLGARAWKRLHLLAYPGWLAFVVHVAFGAMQTPRGTFIAGLLGAAIVGVGGLHLMVGWRARRLERRAQSVDDGWLRAGRFADLRDGHAVRVCADPDRPIAVFRHGDLVSAIAGTCVHQGGPLAEGRIVGGCVTCPWHGYQYRPDDGCSPPPFTEKLATHRVRVRDGIVEVDPVALPAGTRVEPARGGS